MKGTKLLITIGFVIGVIAVLAAQSAAYPPFVNKAKKFGAKDCTFCHVNADGGPPWNERGQWLIKEKERRGADAVDVEWLADFKSDKQPEGSSLARTTTVAPGSQASTAPPSLTDQLFVSLEQQWMEAVVKRDQPSLDRIMGDEFTLASAYSTGERTSKDQFIKNVLQSVKSQEFTFHDSHADLYGDVAVFKSRVKSTYTFDKDDRTGDYIVTDVWVKRDGRWQVVTRHSSLPVKSPAKS